MKRLVLKWTEARYKQAVESIVCYNCTNVFGCYFTRNSNFVSGKECPCNPIYDFMRAPKSAQQLSPSIYDFPDDYDFQSWINLYHHSNILMIDDSVERAYTGHFAIQLYGLATHNCIQLDMDTFPYGIVMHNHFAISIYTASYPNACDGSGCEPCCNCC